MTKFLLAFFSFGWLRGLDFLPPLLLRLFLAPILWVSGQQKLGLFTSQDTAWYNPLTWVNSQTYQAAVDSMSSAPLIGQSAGVMTGVIGGIEIIAAFLLLIGFAVRWISLPILALVVLTAVMALGGQDLMSASKAVLLSHGYENIDLTAFSKSLIFFLMLFALFFMGAGRFISVDWFLYRKLKRKIARSAATKQFQEKLDEDPFEIDNTTD